MKTYKITAISIVVIIIGVIIMGTSKYSPVKEFNIVQRKGQIHQDSCNQKQRFGNKIVIPKEVCIPSEHIISYIYPSVDLNGDGLEDLVIRHCKETLKNGDSRYLSIYIQNIDGSYRLAKDLPNIYPIYFKTYTYSKKFEDSLSPELKKIWNIYDQSPLYGIYLKEKEIELKINALEAQVSYFLHFIYNKEKNTWILHKWEEYTDYNNVIIEREIPEGWKILIDDFDYLDYLDW